jgi:tetratricopeptide (TPR) repeat protein
VSASGSARTRSRRGRRASGSPRAGPGAEGTGQSARHGGRSSVASFLALLAVALVARLLYLHAYRTGLPFHLLPIVDSAYYHRWAVDLLQGLGPGGAFPRAPGYAYLLAAAYALAGRPDPGTVEILQMLLGMASLALLWHLSRRLWGPRGALVTGILALGAVPLLFLETKLLPTTAAAFGSLSGLSLLEAGWRQGPRRAGRILLAASGLVFGWTGLLRPNLMLLGVALALLLWLTGPEDRRRLLWFGAGLLLGILPATVHNLRACWRHPVLVSANGGMNFAIGHHPGNGTGLYVPPAALATATNPWEQEAQARRLAEQAAGRPLCLGEVDRYWFRQGWDFIRRHPAAELRLLGLKLLRMLETREYPNNYSLALERDLFPGMRLSMPFWLLLLAGLGGLAAARGRIRSDPPRRFLFLALLLLAGTAVVSMLYFCVMTRFRVFLTLPLLVLAGGAPAALDPIRRREAGWRRRMLLVGLLAASALAPTLVAPPTPRDPLAFGHLQAGLTWLEVGQPRRALDALRRSAQIQPTPDAALGIARSYLALGQPGRAVRELRQARAEFPEDPRLADLLGTAYMTLGRAEEARTAFEEAIRRDPSFAQPLFNLASLLASRGDHAAAIPLFRRVLRLQPGDREATRRLARCYEAIGQPDSARILYESVLPGRRAGVRP